MEEAIRGGVSHVPARALSGTAAFLALIQPARRTRALARRLPTNQVADVSGFAGTVHGTCGP
jgi:hypothetical protein